MAPTLSCPWTLRRRALLVVGGLAILLVACLGPVPPLQTMTLARDPSDRAVVASFGGLWYDADLLQMVVVNAVKPSEIQVRLPPMFVGRHAWIEGDQIRIAVETGEERREGTMVLFKLDDRRIGVTMADDPHGCMPIIYERLTAVGVVQVKATRALHSAYDDAIGWLASVL